MRSLESLNQALGVLHHWKSDMSVSGTDEDDIDAKIAAACLHRCCLRVVCDIYIYI